MILPCSRTFTFWIFQCRRINIPIFSGSCSAVSLHSVYTSFPIITSVTCIPVCLCESLIAWFYTPQEYMGNILTTLVETNVHPYH